MREEWVESFEREVSVTYFQEPAFLTLELWILFSDAAPYLPTDDTTTDEGNLKSPPPIHCHLGPIKSQTLIEMNMLESHSMCWSPTSSFFWSDHI